MKGAIGELEKGYQRKIAFPNEWADGCWGI
jgi:hypothetical protein